MLAVALGQQVQHVVTNQQAKVVEVPAYPINCVELVQALTFRVPSE